MKPVDKMVESGKVANGRNMRRQPNIRSQNSLIHLKMEYGERFHQVCSLVLYILIFSKKYTPESILIAIMEGRYLGGVMTIPVRNDFEIALWLQVSR